MSTRGLRRRWSVAPPLIACVLLAAETGHAMQRGRVGGRIGYGAGRAGYWSPGRGMGNYLGGSIRHSNLAFPRPPVTARTLPTATRERNEQLRTAKVRPAHYGSVRHGRYGTDIAYTPPNPSVPLEPAPESVHFMETPLGTTPIVPMPWGSPTMAGQRFWGGVVTDLPEHCVQVDIDTGRYYFYDNGYYYRRCFYTGDVCYIGVRPEVGVWVPSLPQQHDRIQIGNTTYCQYNDVYYVRQRRDETDGFVVVEAPPEASTDAASDRRTTEEPLPDPFDILKQMSDFLASAEQFQVDVVDMTEAQMENGQMILVSSRCNALVARPQGFRIEIKGDGIDKQYYYDGKTVKSYNRWKNTWTNTHVPASIDAALDYIADRFGVAIPVSDMLYANIYNALVPTANDAAYLGINGPDEYRGHHLVFRGPMVDWQLWVRPGDEPVPLKLVIDYKHAEGAPEYTATFRNWNFSPQIAVNAFTFRTPATAWRVDLNPDRRTSNETVEDNPPSDGN